MVKISQEIAEGLAELQKHQVGFLLEIRIPISLLHSLFFG